MKKILICCLFLSIGFGQCPTAGDVLTNSGEIGIIGNNSFSCQVDNGSIYNSQTQYFDDCGTKHVVRYSTFTGQQDPYIAPLVWHRFDAGGTIFYLKPPTNTTCGLNSRDATINVDGDLINTTCTITWANYLTTSPPSGWGPPKPYSFSFDYPALKWSHTWDANVSDMRYQVFRSTTAGGAYTTYGGPTTSLNYAPSHAGYYKIKAKLDNVYSDFTSNYVYISTPPSKIAEIPNTIPKNIVNETISNSKIIHASINPSNPILKISYSIAELTNTNVSIFDLMGKKVTELVNEQKGAGEYSITWNAGSSVPSGIYLVVLQAGETVDKAKVTLLK